MSNDKKPPRRALGMGLDALLPASPTSSASGKYGEGAVFRVPIERIRPAADQPRKHIDDGKLEELAQSIREHGVIEPVVVRRFPANDAGAGALGDRYEIIAGERRWRASQRAGLKELVVVVKDVTPERAFELALVENLQREDLNPIETAEAYERLMSDHGYTQEELAARVGKSRPAVANALRLLKLPVGVRRLVHEGSLTEGHARALLGAPDEPTLASLAEQAVRGHMSVRRVEALVRGAAEKRAGAAAGAEKPAGKSASIRDLEQRLARRLGVRVDIEHRAPGGTVMLQYASLDDFDRLLALLDPH